MAISSTILPIMSENCKKSLWINVSKPLCFLHIHKFISNPPYGFDKHRLLGILLYFLA